VNYKYPIIENIMQKSSDREHRAPSFTKASDGKAGLRAKSREKKGNHNKIRLKI